MAELDPRSALEHARAMLRYVESFNGQKFDTTFDEPDRQNLAMALDHLTETAAMLLNMADRVASPPRAIPAEQAAPTEPDEAAAWDFTSWLQRLMALADRYWEASPAARLRERGTLLEHATQVGMHWRARALAAHPHEAADRSAEADTARLDYLQECVATVDLPWNGKHFEFRIGGLHRAVHRDIRIAIDAAMGTPAAAEPGKGEGK